MSNDTIENRIELLEKSERKFRCLQDQSLDYFANHLRDVRQFKAVANIMIVIVILFSLIIAPVAVFQCWQVWNGYSVVVIDMNGTAKCDQCDNRGKNSNSK